MACARIVGVSSHRGQRVPTGCWRNTRRHRIGCMPRTPAHRPRNGPCGRSMSRTHLGTVAFLGLCACGLAVAAEEPSRIAPTPLLPIQDAYPHVSRDGSIVFQSNRIGGSKLFVVKLDGTGLRQLTTGPGDDVTPVWSPDGASVMFTSDRAGNEDVWIIKADGTEARNLTNNPASDSHPKWSPDGRQVVFCSTRGDGE